MSELESAPATVAVPQQRTPADPPAVTQAPVPDVVREFRVVHDAMRHGAGLLVKSAEVLRPGPTPRATELARCAEALLAFVHHHHTGEDEHWWPSLRERSAAAGSALAPLTEDHSRLDPLLDTLRLHVELLRAGTHDVGALRRDLAELHAHLLKHLAAEEPVLFPLLAAHMEPAEAARLGKVMATSAPRSGLSYLLGSMHDAASPEDQQVILQKMPAPIRWARPLLLRRYRRRVALLTRT